VNASTFLDKFPDIKLVKSDVNLGFAKGNNLGISHSTGEFICLINSDASFKTGPGDSAINLLENNDVGFVTGKLLFPNGTVQHNCQPFPSGIKIAAQLLRIHKLISKRKRSSTFQSCYFDYNSVGYPDWVWGTFILLKRSTLQYFINNQLPETFFMYCEDIEWSYILRENR